MSNFKKLEDPIFREKLDMIHKGYVDKMYHDANKQPPIPTSLIPLQYSDARIEKGLNQMRQGAKNALFALDR